MPSLLGPGPEFDLIRRFLAAAPGAEAAGLLVGPGDDAAVLQGGLVISTDMTVEGVHYRREWLSGREVGYRAAAGALSDLAAMAAAPLGVLVSLAVPSADAGDYAADLMDGVTLAVRAIGGTLLGGDLTRSSGPVVLDVTVLGRADPPVLRSGARPGGGLWVTGRLGAAALAVRRVLAGEPPEPEARERFARPEPRVREALWLSARGVPVAMLDLSDGLLGDAGHLAAASGLAVVLDARAVPVHPVVARAADSDAEALRLAVSGGEDYELCFAADPADGAAVEADFRAEFGLPLTRVGTLEAGEGVWWGGAARTRASGGFQHFGGGA
jgi:thiamine-monophosphate kinase